MGKRLNMKSKTDATSRHNFNIKPPYWIMIKYDIQDCHHLKTQF
jgi:hypothetical protein